MMATVGEFGRDLAEYMAMAQRRIGAMRTYRCPESGHTFAMDMSSYRPYYCPGCAEAYLTGKEWNGYAEGDVFQEDTI
jgi:hypothetical protein